jgi:peptide/nickel transport system substrate-binding protein
MRFIALRWPVVNKRVFALLTIFVFAPALYGSTKPRYGGTLRVEFLAQAVSLDPRAWKPGSREFATNERLAALVFDRLISLDNYGRFVPQLGTEWSHDSSSRRWQFAIRAGVKFSDGTPLTAADVVTALSPLLPEGVQVSASGENLIFHSSEPRPDLLELLASGRFFVFRVQADGALLGTGPFTLESSTKQEKTAGSEPTTVGMLMPQIFRFSSNESCWAGRPFLDKIEVSFGVPPLRALFDLQLGKADLVELAPDIVRRANQSNVRVWSSSPLTLYALRFDDTQPQAANDQLREALFSSLDRSTMAGVLLQKQAEPAAALLPQWLSGYAFLFHAEMDLDRAKQLRASLPANVAGGTSPLRLQTDASGDLARLLAERVAVNARQTGLTVQPLNKNTVHDASRASEAADLHLFPWRYSSLSPGEELRALAKAAHAEELKEGNLADADRRYAGERKILEERKVTPLVALPDYAGLAPAVRDWQPSPWGEWRLADVWLEPSAVQKNGTPSAPATPGARP